MIEIKVEVTEKVNAILERLVETGFYGGSVEQAAERIICRVLDERQQSESILGDRGACSASSDGRHFPGCGCE